MWVNTYNGRTECSLEKFAEIEPAVLKVREGFFKACEEQPQRISEHKLKVYQWCQTRFGLTPWNRDFERICGPGHETITGWAYQGNESVKKWDAFVSTLTPADKRRYYSHEIVAACIMAKDGEDNVKG